MKRECPLEVFLFVGERIAESTCSDDACQKTNWFFGAWKNPKESQGLCHHRWIGSSLLGRPLSPSPYVVCSYALAWVTCRGRCLRFVDLNHSISLHLGKG